MRGLSGIRAGLLGAAGGGALVTALAMAAPTPSTPAMAAPASCSPTANGQGGSGTATAATGTQTCTGGDTGLAYTATGGNLTVNLNNDAINGFAVNINDDGGDLTGSFCTRRIDRILLGKEHLDGKEEVRSGADSCVAAAG
jgi:hypothetical protein